MNNSSRVGIGSFYGAAAALACVYVSGLWLVPYGIPDTWTAPRIAATCGAMIATQAFMDHRSRREKLFINCGLTVQTEKQLLIPKRMRKIRKECGYDLVLTLPPGMCLQNFIDKQEHISQAMDAAVTFAYNNGCIIMQVRPNVLKRSYPYELIQTDGDLALMLGKSKTGNIILDLANSPSPHLGIFGETNGGKSVILRGIITQIIASGKNVQLHLIDPKRVEFVHFRKSSFVKCYAREDAEIIEDLRELVAETDRRYRLLERHEKVNIREYNKHKNGKLPYILCVVDEYADLAGNKVMAEMVNYIARKARAVGVHLILACQRPDADILNGKIKANIGNIVGLKCTTPINSRIIIDKEGLEVLRGYGHGILKCGSIYTEMQSMMIEVEEAKQLVQHTFVSKAQKPEAVAVKPMLRGYL